MTTLFNEDNMTTELLERPAKELPALSPDDVLRTAIADPTIDPARLQGFMDLYERLQASRAADDYGKALAEFQAKCPQIHKTRSIDLGGGKGPKYASLDDIMREI